MILLYTIFRVSTSPLRLSPYAFLDGCVGPCPRVWTPFQQRCPYSKQDLAENVTAPFSAGAPCRFTFDARTFMLLSSTSMAPREAPLDSMPDTLCPPRALQHLRIPFSLHSSTHSLSATEKTSRPHLRQTTSLLCHHAAKCGRSHVHYRQLDQYPIWSLRRLHRMPSPFRGRWKICLMAERYLVTSLETTPGILLTDCSGSFTMASGFTLPVVSLYTIRVCRAAQSGKVPVLKTFLTQPPSPDHSYFLIAFFLLRIQSMTLQLTLCREKKQSYFDCSFSVDQ